VQRVRYLGIFHDPNDLGILFVASLPLAWYGASEFRGSAIRYLFVAAAALIVYALYLTKSRGGMLSLGFILLLALWRHFDYVKAAVVTATLAVLGAGLQLRKESLGGGDQSSLDRIDGWALGMDLFQSNPLFGVGYDHFMDYYFLTAHNSFVLVLAETGIVGYLLWVSFFVVLMTLLLRVSLKPEGLKLAEAEPWDSLDPWQRISWIFFLALAGYLFGSFFLSQTYTIFLFLLAAFATSAWMIGYRHYHPEEADLSSAWSVVPVSMVAAVGSIAVLWMVIRVLIKISY
jgi:O-antigen ligase